jgi:ubiquinone/menaquinone biosynthesis C-methylase UbiE
VQTHVNDVGLCSYEPERFGQSIDREISRLRDQADLSWTVEQRRLSELGVRDGQCVLEAGCGPGFVTQRLAEWLPRSRIFAIDSDPRMLAIAQHARMSDQISFINTSVYAINLPDNSIDIAISRYLFQHLDQPVDAAAEIRRVLRPNGAHVIIDIDDKLWGLSEPTFPAFEKWYGLVAQSQAKRGGDRFRGRHLGRILRQAGYSDVTLDVFAYNSDDVGLDAFRRQLDPDLLLPLLNDERLTMEDYVRARTLSQTFMNSPTAFILSLGFIVLGRKRA